MYLDSSYPTAVICIIATEFCERFSFCGLRTILSLYLRNILLFSENASTVIYHVFNMVCYLVPIVGAICADSYFGRYRTIRNFSLIYLIGNVLMCVAVVPVLDHNPILMSSMALLLVAVGTGGLKPCVAAFGAEQFHLPDQFDLLRDFFSIFYFTINLGGFAGMVITPILRESVTCFGDDSCYPLGFGFPMALMVLAILFFVLGKKFYKVKTPKRNIILEFLNCSVYALAQRVKESELRHEHWLDYARRKFDIKLIADMKAVFSILLLYTPLPIFWSLFDQQGSRWTFQASHMDGNILGMQIIPDQMQVINPAMVLVLIPIFDKVFYPGCDKINVLQNSLHRMAIGGLFAGLAFIAAGILELVLETTYPEMPVRNHGSLNVINTLPCSLSITNPFNRLQVVDKGEIFRFKNMPCHNRTEYGLMVEAPLRCGLINFKREVFKLSAVFVEYQVDTVLIGINSEDEIQGYVTDPIDFKKSISGAPRIRIDFIKTSKLLSNLSVTFQSTTGLQDSYFLSHTDDEVLIGSPYIEIPQGVYECRIASAEKTHLYEKYFHFALGGVYSLVIREHRGEIAFVKLFTMSDPNSVNILWQIPQYFLISVAEIMFGVAGLEFSFTQAPKSMKTVTIAGWYLSTAVGNLFVIVITQLNMFKSQAYEFFMFALLIVADMALFMEMASKYEFSELDVESSAFILRDGNPTLEAEDREEGTRVS
ncbi:peptide transporter family 1-like [Cylas formicarius]|uniref:peptide transporter family 1-like n=1 Tax=Cylas formicarius TaxID=197179 RepID=UPI002958BF55|nr:peptide transporter family 1-like [Cylas formicarius]